MGGQIEGRLKMKCLLGKLAACLLFVAAGTTQSFSSSVAPLTNEEVLATADSVFIGTVIASESRATGPRGQIIVTDYQIRVERLLADDGSIARDQHAGVVTLTFAGGTIGERGMDVSGIPRLNAGDRAFFFVEAPARRSFSPLVGLYQGLYRIRTINGVERVTHEDACCTGGDGVVRVPMMSKLAPAAGNGFTADEFAAQITAALPKVRELPALRHTAAPTLDPALPRPTRCSSLSSARKRITRASFSARVASSCMWAARCSKRDGAALASAPSRSARTGCARGQGRFSKKRGMLALPTRKTPVSWSAQ
jgi:hypothetical protein